MADLKNPPKITPSTQAYVKHIETIQDDPEKLYSHIYVRHLGTCLVVKWFLKKYL